MVTLVFPPPPSEVLCSNLQSLAPLLGKEGGHTETTHPVLRDATDRCSTVSLQPTLVDLKSQRTCHCPDTHSPLGEGMSQWGYQGKRSAQVQSKPPPSPP